MKTLLILNSFVSKKKNEFEYHTNIERNTKVFLKKDSRGEIFSILFIHIFLEN